MPPNATFTELQSTEGQKSRTKTIRSKAGVNGTSATAVKPRSLITDKILFSFSFKKVNSDRN